MRLKSEMWVMAYVRSVASAGAAAFVVRRGDADGGAIFVRINRLDGTSLVFGPAFAGFEEADIERRFSSRLNGEAASDEAVEDFLAREVGYDGDLWVVEVEDRSGRHFLGDWLTAI